MTMQLHRWPKSVHSQVEAMLHGVRAFGQSKAESPLGVRSIGTWQQYRAELHRFADFLLVNQVTSLLDVEEVHRQMERYLAETVARLERKGGSLQTLEKTLAALGKLECAVNRFAQLHELDLEPLDCADLRRSCHGEGPFTAQEAVGASGGVGA